MKMNISKIFSTKFLSFCHYNLSLKLIFFSPTLFLIIIRSIIDNKKKWEEKIKCLPTNIVVGSDIIACCCWTANAPLKSVDANVAAATASTDDAVAVSVVEPFESVVDVA